VLAWAVVILFLWQWVWAYDACRAGGELGGSRTLCLGITLWGQLIGWVLAFWLTIIALVERILP
jgi:hypothetical protein